jgi:protein gp37
VGSGADHVSLASRLESMIVGREGALVRAAAGTAIRMERRPRMLHSMKSSRTSRRRLPERFHSALKSFHAFSEVSQDEIRALLGQCLQVDHHAHQILGRMRRMVLQLGERDFKFVFNLVVGTLSHDVSSGRFRR